MNVAAASALAHLATRHAERLQSLAAGEEDEDWAVLYQRAAQAHRSSAAFWSAVADRSSKPAA
jgi:hypothetical protein